MACRRDLWQPGWSKEGILSLRWFPGWDVLPGVSGPPVDVDRADDRADESRPLGCPCTYWT